jgi:hypothetical protein
MQTGAAQSKEEARNSGLVEQCGMRPEALWAKLGTRADDFFEQDLPSAFCLLPSASCFLPSAFCSTIRESGRQIPSTIWPSRSKWQLVLSLGNTQPHRRFRAVLDGGDFLFAVCFS